MIPCFRTSRMEETALALDAAYDTVMVRSAGLLPNPVRIRVKMLESIRPFYGRNDPAFDSEFARWKAENGTLINYRPQHKREPILPHDACFLTECPLSIDLIEGQARDTRKVCVVYKPPTWRQHEEVIFTKYPSGTSCKRLIQAVKAVKPTPELARMAQALGIPTAGTYAIADEALRESLGVSMIDFPPLRKRALRHIDGRRFSSVIELVPRIEPEDESLLGMYRYIKDSLPAVGHIRLARDGALSKAARFWKISLKALVRSGSVEQKRKICFYFMDGIAPDYKKIDAEHQGAKARLTRLIQFVDSLPEYRVPVVGAQSSGFPVQAESSVRLSDTGH